MPVKADSNHPNSGPSVVACTTHRELNQLQDIVERLHQLNLYIEASAVLNAAQRIADQAAATLNPYGRSGD
jgi:hypothetical protein